MFNNRGNPTPVEPPKKRMHVLEQFPEPELEAVVIQWRAYAPTVLVQLLREDRKFESGISDFVDATTGQPYAQEAHNADILFSQRAFAVLQPEPDLVLPPEQLWECRAEALAALQIQDRPIDVS